MNEDGTYRYDVALSFAGEQRKYAFQLAQKLKQCDLDVFYDNWEAASLWGESLPKALAKRYREESLFCVALFSKEYNTKIYPRMEFEHMQFRQYQEDAYILPIVMDGSFPDEWPRTRSYIDSSQYTIDEIALMIRNKVYSKMNALKNTKPDFHKETNKMTIFCEGEEDEEVEVLLSFRFTDNNAEYVIYTKNEYDEHGNVTIYVAGVERDSGKPVLTSVHDSDWNRIRIVLQKLAKDVEDDSTSVLNDPFFTSDGIELL